MYIINRDSRSEIKGIYLYPEQNSPAVSIDFNGPGKYDKTQTFKIWFAGHQTKINTIILDTYLFFVPSEDIQVLFHNFVFPNWAKKNHQNDELTVILYELRVTSVSNNLRASINTNSIRDKHFVVVSARAVHPYKARELEMELKRSCWEVDRL